MPIPAGSSGCGSVCPAPNMPDLPARFGAMSARMRLTLLGALGVLAGLGQAPIDLWPATIIGIAALMLAHQVAQTTRAAALQAWAFGAGYFALSLRWIVEPFLVDVAHHGWMAPFAVTLMAAGAGLFWAVAAYGAARLAPRSALMLALGLVWAEATRSLILTGFPWALLGHIWVPTPIAQLAAFGGPHLLTLVTVLTGWGVALVVTRRWSGAIVLVAVVAVGLWLRAGPAPSPVADAPIVRLAQPNAPQHLKWDPAYRDVFLQRLVSFTESGVIPDLVVWPETSVPTLLNFIENDLSLLADAARGAPLVFGIQRRDTDGRFYNSLIALNPQGEIAQIYDKRHLVPFGEYMPGGALARSMGLTGLADRMGSGFAPGRDAGLVDLPGIGGAVPLICYEGIFAEEIYRGPDRPRLLLLITNDAWFGQAAGPYQHLAQARLRAIEQGLPMVRVANTGVSAMIDGRGRIIAEIPLGIDGVIDAPLPAALPITPYARWGEWPFFLMLIFLTLGLYVVVRRNSD